MNWRWLTRSLSGALILLLIVALVWASDRITLQGERTIYSVKCDGGVWVDTRCTGKLVPAERYAFRVSPTRQEVLYWIRGSAEPSGKYSDCTVKDRDNWTCNIQLGQKPSVAYEMKKGRPTRGGGGLSMQFHDVPKWKWWLMDMGVGGFSDASS
jgi:hypothetical protein